jgi:hypothetical protein
MLLGASGQRTKFFEACGEPAFFEPFFYETIQSA